MRALVFDGSLRYTTSHPEPTIGTGEALVHVLVAGVCNTDLELVKGYMGFDGVLGHEFVGVVEQCDDAAWVGKRVVGEINCGCGECDLCRGGDARHCPGRTVLGILNRDGAFADRVVLPIRNLHVVPDAVPTHEAVFVEPLAAAFEILEQVAVHPSSHVLVLGDGKLGQLVAQVLATTDCALRVVGKHPEKLRLLQERGIEATLLEQFSAQPTADVVVECTGTSAGMGMAMASVRPRGTIVLKSTVADPSTLHLAPLVIHEISVVGSRCGPFEPALRALAHKTVGVGPLLHRSYSLKHGVEAMEFAATRGALKVVLHVSE